MVTLSVLSQLDLAAVAAGHEGGDVANPFVFPTGRTCRSFNELALACQEEWSTACDLFQQGYLKRSDVCNGAYAKYCK